MRVVSRAVHYLTDEPAQPGEMVLQVGQGVYRFGDNRRFERATEFDYEGCRVADARTGKCYVFHRGRFVPMASLMDKPVRPRIFFVDGAPAVVDARGRLLL